MMTIDDIRSRLVCAEGTDRLVLLAMLARQLVCSDRICAAEAAREACALSSELHDCTSSTVVCARATALFVLDVCRMTSAVGPCAEEAYRLLSVLTPPSAARVLLRAGQMYQAVGRYDRALHCFHHARFLLDDMPARHHGAPTGV